MNSSSAGTDAFSWTASAPHAIAATLASERVAADEMRPPDGSDIACNFDCGTESRGSEVGGGPLVGLAHVEQERVAAGHVGLDGLEVGR